MADYGKDKKIEIATRLKQLREDENLTQEALSKKIKISKPTIISWERTDGNNKIPNMNQLITLADFYKVSVGHLLCEYESYGYEDGKQELQLGISSEALNVLQPSLVTPFAENEAERKPHYEENKTLSYLIENSREIVSTIDSIKHMQEELSDYQHDPEHQKYETIFYRIDVYFDSIVHGSSHEETHDARRDVFIDEMKKVIEKDGVGERPCSLISWKDYGRLFDILKGYERNALMYKLHEQFDNIVKAYIEERSDDHGKY